MSVADIPLEDRPLGDVDLLSPVSYARDGYPWAVWDRRRRESPVHRFHHGGAPFSNRFTPRALESIHGEIERIAHDIVQPPLDKGDEGSVEFVENVLAPLPIAVVAWLLGVPESDWNLIFDWTNRIIGVDDPKYHPEGRTKEKDGQAAITELFSYFTSLVEERCKNPKEVMITLFTKSEVNGKPLQEIELGAPVDRLHPNLVGGIKRLPIRYELRAA